LLHISPKTELIYLRHQCANIISRGALKYSQTGNHIVNENNQPFIPFITLLKIKSPYCPASSAIDAYLSL